MTPEHALARCGNATSSEFGAILAAAKDGKERKTRNAYARRLAAERLTRKPVATFHNGHMDRGQEQEPRGIMAYEARTGNIVERLVGEAAFLKHPELAAGCSPDGLIDLDGGCEGKCVISTVQIETVEARGYPSEHKPQVQGSLWITGRRYWDFWSFCPDMPTPELRLYVFRVERDEEYIERLEREVRSFLLEVDALCDRLMGVDRTEALLRTSMVAA